MKFGGFKIGKSKNKEVPIEEPETEIPEDAIANIEEDTVLARPHAPLGELSLESEEKLDGPDYIPADEPEEPALDAGEGVKMVEVQIAPAAPPEEKNEPSAADLNASIHNIFNNVEDEENPLASLIKTLPDVSATELIDDLKEINEIIKDWQKK